MLHRLNKAGLEIIKSIERFMPKKYIDAVGYPTIGYGHKILKGEVFPDSITEEEAEELLRKDVAVAESYVNSLVSVPITDNMFSALVSLVFNIGGGAFRASTLRSKLNRFDYVGASDEFTKWTYAGGVHKIGLLKRRLIEQALFNGYF